MKVAICMTHGHVPKWLQTSVYSLKLMKNEVQSDIFIACSWPEHPSIKAITENDLGEGITFIDCKRRLHSHATGLDEILDYLADKDYDYMFTMETDCRATKPGWLDWFCSFMKDKPEIGIAGFFWHEGNNHYNINSSGTLYRMDMLLKYHREVREKKSPMFWHPNGNRHDSEQGMDPTIKDVVGVFSETRGIEAPSPSQLEVILKGIPFAAWFEPGAWLYARLQGEWGEIQVPCDHIYANYPGHTAPEATYYGGRENVQFVHYWGGSRAHDWRKHPVSDNFVKSCAPAWIVREDTIWKATVPERYRGIVHEVNQEEDIIKLMNDNLGFIIPEAL